MQEDLNKNFIKNIEIKNFKCFEDFKAEGFGRVNLIAGKNNVGKTAFMEACYLNVHAQDINTMLTAIVNVNHSRKYVDIINKSEIDSSLFTLFKKYSSRSNLHLTNFEFTHKDAQEEFIFEIDNLKKVINGSALKANVYLISNIKYLDTHGFSSSELRKVYVVIQKSNEEDTLNKLINQFDDSINNFKIIDDNPEIFKDNKWSHIREFGDGLRIKTIYLNYLFIICM